MLNDFVRTLLSKANLIQNTARSYRLDKPQLVPKQYSEKERFDSMITDDLLREVSRQLYYEGHYAIAVEEAYKCLNNFVKSKSGLDEDGSDLMRKTFSIKKPVLKLNKLRTKSQKNQQIGYMDIFAGCMTGIRNPRAHEHRYLDEPHVALEMLSLANHLFRFVKSSKKLVSRKQNRLPRN